MGWGQTARDPTMASAGALRRDRHGVEFCSHTATTNGARATGTQAPGHFTSLERARPEPGASMAGDGNAATRLTSRVYGLISVGTGQWAAGNQD